MIQIKNLVKRYVDLVALDHLNLDIRGRSIWAAGTEWLRKDYSDQLSVGIAQI